MKISELRDAISGLPGDMNVWIAKFTGKRIDALPMCHVFLVNMGGTLMIAVAADSTGKTNRPDLIDSLRRDPAKFGEFVSAVNIAWCEEVARRKTEDAAREERKLAETK
jgi:hypothetical protein